MKTFTDAAGRTWTVALNLESAMRVRDLLGIDLLTPEVGNPPVITRIGTDEILLGQVLLALLQPQFEAHKVTEADVRTGFDGRTILDAQTAFYAELVDFFQSRGRTDRAKAVALQAKVIGMAISAIGTKIDEMSPQTLIDGALSGSLPAQSESTPDP